MSLVRLIHTHTPTHTLLIASRIHLYGAAADPALATAVAAAIDTHWNEPRASVQIGKNSYQLAFRSEGIYVPDLEPETVWYNDDPANYYFRVEDFVLGDISFVDGIGSNTGYFKKANLLQTSTTAAHEFGHCLGLDHPAELDIRGGQQPGIMYPRGTICDPAFQYDPESRAGDKGGTLDPRHRQVTLADIQELRLHKLRFSAGGEAVLGGFSSIYHFPHEPAE